jgi:DNA-binding winged helix-turn-helix (wHTH) protein/TolB-like protein
MTVSRFRFGQFEFDAGARELRCDGALVHLQSQPAQVLACLVSRPRETVTREELRKAIWGNGTFVDFDRGLNFCIAQIRSALDDDPAAPRFIRTLPKRGYQFIAPVERVNEAASSPPGAHTPSISEHSRRTATWIWAGALFVALAAVAGFWLRSWALSKHPPIVAVVRFDNETTDPGMSRFSDGLTDNVVEELTKMSGGRYAVIGNAQILRLSRDQRNLKTIGTALHAAYIVLGQVQSDGAQTRILVHLIRLPDQTHLWVVRADGAISDPLNVESSTAQKVGTEFSKRIILDSSRNRLPGLPNS